MSKEAKTVRPKIYDEYIPALNKMTSKSGNPTRLVNDLIRNEIRTVEFVPVDNSIVVKYDNELIENIHKSDPEFDQKLIELKNKYLKP